MNFNFLKSSSFHENIGLCVTICFLFRLLGEVDAFDLGHTFDPKTFGIWMGTKILVGKDKNGKEMAILLLDTEGIGREVFLRLN